MRIQKTPLLLTGAFIIASLAACGSDTVQVSGNGGGGGGGGNGGGSATVLSGVAATGAPIDGSVCALDRTGVEVGCVDTAADGSFSVTTTGRQGPFLLAAIPDVGQTLYSWSNAANATVNVTPFTTLALLVATDYANLDDYYAAWSSYRDSFDQATLNTAVSRVLEHFASVLQGAVAAGFNPFSTPFAANGTGVDGVLDGLDFNFDFAGGAVSVNGEGVVITLDPTVPTGNWRLTLSVSIAGAPSQQVAVVDNIPKPNNQSEFCVPELYDDYFSGIGSYTVTNCSFDGQVGSITANVSVSGFSLVYTATYSYTPLS